MNIPGYDNGGFGERVKLRDVSILRTFL